MKKCLILIVSFVVAGMFVACSRGPCQTDADCEAGQNCYGGFCAFTQKCIPGKNCDKPENKSKICQLGETLCEGNILKTCASDGKGWQTTDCGFFHRCESGQCLRKGVSKTCGNGKREPNEQCDDGNQRSGDGCSRYCLNETITRMEPPAQADLPKTFVIGNNTCRQAANRAITSQHKAMLYVKIAPIVCRQDGRPILPQTTIDANVAYLNQVYKAANLTFVLVPTQFEDDPDRCEVFYSTEGTSTLNRYSQSDAIAVFYAMNISGGSFSLAGYANHSGVVMKAGPTLFGPISQSSLNRTLAHELGHAFGLDHPHACRNGEENPNNCGQSGDQLCDTPYDPGPKGVNGLAYCGGERKDGQCTVSRGSSGCTVSCPNGAAPLVDNLMSYYHCGAALTPDQIATIRCIALNDQIARVSLQRPCQQDSDCGTDKCVDGRCSTNTTACLHQSDCTTPGERCIAGTCTACMKDGSLAGSPDFSAFCCSNTADAKGICCSGKSCCGPSNHSFYQDGKCECQTDYTWEDPQDPTNFSCQLHNGLSCLLDGMAAHQDGSCCSKRRDDQGKCCTGGGCCGIYTNSFTDSTTGECTCKLGFTRLLPNSTTNFFCRKNPDDDCLRDFSPASTNDACCSKERDSKGRCCTGNACCGSQNHSLFNSQGKCVCEEGYTLIAPHINYDYRCQLVSTPGCIENGKDATSDEVCCSKERDDQGRCCTGKECCAARHFSETVAGVCQCIAGYTWTAPNAQGDHRCQKYEPPPCQPDGKTADATNCCSKQNDESGTCCSGVTCCSADNFATYNNNACECLAGYVRTNPDDPKDVSCHKQPTPPAQTSCSLSATLKGHSSSITGVAIHPNGTLVASSSYDKTIRVWDVATHKQLFLLREHKSSITSVIFSSDGKRLISGDYSRTYIEWDPTTGKVIAKHTLPQAIRVIRQHPNGLQLAFSTLKGIFVKASAGAAPKQIEPTLYPRALAYHPNGTQLAFGTTQKSVHIHNTTNLARVHRLTGHSYTIFSVGYNHNGSILATGSKELKLWESQTGTLLRTFKTHKTYTFSMAWHPSQDVIFTGGLSEPTIKLWDAKKGTLLQTLTGHTRGIYSMAISPNGNTLVTGSSDKTVKLWSCSP